MSETKSGIHGQRERQKNRRAGCTQAKAFVDGSVASLGRGGLIWLAVTVPGVLHVVLILKEAAPSG